MNTATGRHGQETRDGLFHAVSLSGGRDSTSLLLGMIERDMPIDAVLFADTGMEFPEVYENLAMLDDLLSRERGIHVTTLRHPKGFEYLMFDYVLKKPKAVEKRIIRGIIPKGYGWPGVRVRWCTGQLKTHLIEREMRRLKQEKNALHYVGIAADEAWRCKDEIYPLVDWGVTEDEALQICYRHGFRIGGLYEIYHRCSCFCHHPELWAKLREMDDRARRQFGPGPLGQFKPNWSVKRLEERFEKEGRAA